MLPEPEKFTDDSLFDGRLRCRQHASGYRFSLDGVLLANFTAPRPGEKILDLGCGSGIVSLILSYRQPACQITGLEIQPDLAALARENAALNGWQDRITILEGDLRRLDQGLVGQFDRVVSNPPYRKSGSGRRNIDPEQLAARHETLADTTTVVKAAARALKNRGRAAFVYPATRGATLIFELKKQGLEPKRLRIVYSYPGSPAALMLIEAVKGGGEELNVLAPFYVYREKEGEYSQEMAACYRP